jgi:hypothetical protein
MRSFYSIIALLALGAGPLAAAEFRHIGDFLIYERIKITADRITPTAIKPLNVSVFTDGISVRISTENDLDQASEYRIYRSDGIARQQGATGALEVVPGVQAVSEKGGVLRQLRLTKTRLAITSFPGVSNQMIVMRARAVDAPKAVAADPATPISAEDS